MNPPQTKKNNQNKDTITKRKRKLLGPSNFMPFLASLLICTSLTCDNLVMLNSKVKKSACYTFQPIWLILFLASFQVVDIYWLGWKVYKMWHESKITFQKSHPQPFTSKSLKTGFHRALHISDYKSLFYLLFIYSNSYNVQFIYCSYRFSKHQ